MYQNYTNYYPQNNNMRSVTPPVQGLKGRPVSSLEEARAMSIDFDGSVFFFPDLANKKIYTKQINLDGTATMNMYELKEMPAVGENSNNYVTRNEFEFALNKIMGMLNNNIPEPTSVKATTSNDTQDAPGFVF